MIVDELIEISPYLTYIDVVNNNEDIKPFCWVSNFRYQKSIGYFDIRTQLKEIKEFFNRENLNYGILLRSRQFSVFHEDQEFIDKLIIKLTINTNHIDTKSYNLSQKVARIRPDLENLIRGVKL
jgi:hypothetical protein